jgi:hypothetical protein
MSVTRDNSNNSDNIVFSKRVRAGSRTYFMDIKTGKKGEYLVITESKNLHEGGYQRHKIMVFPEDVNKIRDALNEAFDNMDLSNVKQFEDNSSYEEKPKSEQSSNQNSKIDLDEDLNF